MKHIIAAAISLISINAYGYLSLLTTGDLVQPQQIQATAYVESIFDTYDGVNINARGTYGINDELQADIEVGAGEFSGMIGAFAKWVPIPDVNNQPAIGVRAGLAYVDADNTSETAVVAMPFVSKAFETSEGKFTPYGSIPLAITSNDIDTQFSSRLILGTEWMSPLPEYKDMRLIGEVGFELSKSFSSLTIGASYNF